MSYLIPTTEQARAGLRAMKTIFTQGGAIDPLRRDALDAVQRHLIHTDFDVDALPTITPEELAAAVGERALREQLVSGMVTLTLLAEHVDPREADAVERFAAALEVAPAEVKQLRHFVEERMALLRLDVLRRTPGRDGVRRMYEQGGALGLIRNVMSFAGVLENPEVAARYRALEGYPEGSLGKELWTFYTTRDFKFPGEKHGAPEGLLNHDLTHVLGGYDTDIVSEGDVLAFTAGFQQKNPFGVLIFILLQAQHGIRLTAFADPANGGLSGPGIVERMVRAFARGTKVKVDLMGDWDFWAVMGEPVEALRARYGIAPALRG